MSTTPMARPEGGRAAFRATLVAALVPGGGHFVLGRPLAGGLTIVGLAAGALLVGWHLARGVTWFETPLGAFLFTVLLRDLLLVQGFAVADAHLTAVQPNDPEGRRRRLAVLLSLLAPGAGYLLARSWVRAATGLALLALLLFLAHGGRHPYIDVIFFGLQLLMAAFVYRQMLVASEAAEPRAAPGRPVRAQGAQLVLLFALTAVAFGCGYVALRALPDSTLRGLSRDSVQRSVSRDGIAFRVSSLGLSISAMGPGWSVPGSSQYLIAAEHAEGGLFLHIQQAHPFERAGRVAARLRQMLERQRLVHQQTREITLGGAPATQMRFTGDFPGHSVDHWAIAIPQDGFAYVMMFWCNRSSCDRFAPMLEKSRDSLRIGPRS